MNAVRTAFPEGNAGLAFPARLQIRSRIGTVDGLGKYARGTGFAYTSRAAEKISVRKLLPADGILQGPGDIILTYEGFEGIGTILAS